MLPTWPQPTMTHRLVIVSDDLRVSQNIWKTMVLQISLSHKRLKSQNQYLELCLEINWQLEMPQEEPPDRTKYYHMGCQILH